MSLVIVIWVDRRGIMSKAKIKQRERDRDRESIVARKKKTTKRALAGVAVLVWSELERVLQIFGYFCVIGLQNERKSLILVFYIHFFFGVVVSSSFSFLFFLSDVEF